MSLNQTSGMLELRKKQQFQPVAELEFDDDSDTSKLHYDFLCRRCLAGIASREMLCSRAGQVEHAFANPAGILFQIACFSEAPGSIIEGSPTTEFTWFSGYSWQIANCRSCFSHLGWLYVSTNDSFFGLILDRLCEGSNH
ncbi:MAG: hypothetical protein KDD66_01440 [Bdellovibrionales bacterium]|nr:hypothetical protein [Bdellovibrionales bacterium]